MSSSPQPAQVANVIAPDAVEVDVDDTPLDGRVARAMRTKVAVVDAMLSLIAEGDLRPTAPRIAERAGVSLRSVFQHFDDMEALLATAAARAVAQVRELVVPLPDRGTRGERIDAWVGQRARLYEAITPMRRAAALAEPFSPGLRALRDRAHAFNRLELERLFHDELGRLPVPERAEVIEAVEAGTIWESWEHLRTRSGLSKAAARRVFFRTLEALIPSSGGEHAPRP